MSALPRAKALLHHRRQISERRDIGDSSKKSECALKKNEMRAEFRVQGPRRCPLQYRCRASVNASRQAVRARSGCDTRSRKCFHSARPSRELKVCITG